jgi:alpha-ribazole phosphatase
MNLPQGVTNRLILVRHGEPVAAAHGRCYGKLDVGLSADGRRQIEETKEFLQDFELNAVYTSPRQRAVESAKIIAQDGEISSEVCENLAEIDFGDFEGKTYAELEIEFPETFKKWMETPTEVEFPNGESFTQMQARVVRETENILRRHERETIALVSHGGVNRIILAHFLKIPDSAVFRLGQDYASANVIDFYDDFPLIRILNRCVNQFQELCKLK